MITEQGHWQTKLGHCLLEGSPGAKWGVWAYPAPNLYCSWEIIRGLQFELLNNRLQQHVKLFHFNEEIQIKKIIVLWFIEKN